MRSLLRCAARAVAAVAAFSAVVALPGHARAAPPASKLTWFGQACFLLETGTGTRILMDPLSKGIGYEVPQGFRADIVTISHEHSDHNNVGFVTANKPRIIRGLTADKKGWTRVDEKLKDVSIRSVGVYHDGERGAVRGLDTVFIFETGGVRIAHLGDIGHVLNADQLAAIGAVDVLLVPVGGKFTIDGSEATRVIEQLRPRIMVIPMHYKTEASTIKELEPLATFLEGKSNVRHEKTSTIALSPMKPRTAAEIVVLPYR
jgi:L-ascorbate metabolism protein UlaG (beta-lactamase superfamily)